MHRRRGLALIELVAAATIFAVSMMAMFQVWRLCFGMSGEGRDISVASQIARTDLETVRLLGFTNLPLGKIVPNVTPLQGSWTNPVVYCDKDGNLLASGADASLRYYSLTRSGVDTAALLGKDGISYTLGLSSVRSVLASVTRLKDNKVMCTMGVKLVKGGL